VKIGTWVDNELHMALVRIAKAEGRSVSNLLRMAAERIVEEAGTAPIGDIAHETEKLLRRDTRVSSERKI
jgi:hypothetical protein